jgi:hypothetical protein
MRTSEVGNAFEQRLVLYCLRGAQFHCRISCMSSPCSAELIHLKALRAASCQIMGEEDRKEIFDG